MSRIRGLQTGFSPPPKPGSMLIEKTYKRPGLKPAAKPRR